MKQTEQPEEITVREWRKLHPAPPRDKDEDEHKDKGLDIGLENAQVIAIGAVLSWSLCIVAGFGFIHIWRWICASL